ncbi:MAG: sulfur carrier protein ThiS [Candidatus Hydrogenedentota bacterium]
MNITVNGGPRDVVPGTTARQLVASLGVKPEMMAVQINERILPREEMNTTVLSDGDVVELIRIVGGGST